MKVLIIDDEIKAAKMLEIELLRLFPDMQITGIFQQAEAGIKAIDEEHPDLLFLDIEMPKYSGFDVLQACSYKQMQVVFVTAYSEFALDAIKANALDYILKPIDTDELKAAVLKAKEKIVQAQFNQFQFLLEKIDQGENELIKIPSGDQILFFKKEDIICCIAESNYSNIITTEQKLLVSKTLKYMETLLPKDTFVRIHQSFIVNKNHVRAYSRIDGGYVTLSNGMKAKVAKNKKGLLI